jgi:hypothetical protein
VFEFIQPRVRTDRAASGAPIFRLFSAIVWSVHACAREWAICPSVKRFFFTRTSKLLGARSTSDYSQPIRLRSQREDHNQPPEPTSHPANPPYGPDRRPSRSDQDEDCRTEADPGQEPKRQKHEFSAWLCHCCSTAYTPSSLPRPQGFRMTDPSIQADTLRIRERRNAPMVTSARHVERADHQRLLDLASNLVEKGNPGAALCCTLSDGRVAILRRTRSTGEVRGLIHPTSVLSAYAESVLGDDPFWANPAFTDGRQIRLVIPAAGGRQSAPNWCIGVRGPLPGFRVLDATESRAKDRAGDVSRIGSPSARPRAVALHGEPIQRRDIDFLSPTTPARWPLAACISATAASVIFLAVVLALPRRAAPQIVVPAPDPGSSSRPEEGKTNR